MAWEKENVSEWLGAERLGPRDTKLVVPDAIVELLVSAGNEDMWSEDDVLGEGDVITAAEVETWKAVLSDIAKAEKKAIRAADQQRFIRWLRSFGEEDVDGTSSLGLGTPSETALSGRRASGGKERGRHEASGWRGAAA